MRAKLNVIQRSELNQFIYSTKLAFHNQVVNSTNMTFEPMLLNIDDFSGCWLGSNVRSTKKENDLIHLEYKCKSTGGCAGLDEQASF